MNLLKKTKNFVWDEECKEAFKKLKEKLATPLVLSKPNTNKRLIVYLPISGETISVVLIQEEEGELRLVYFVSRVLQDP